jgi:hypothetical protein
VAGGVVRGAHRESDQTLRPADALDGLHLEVGAGEVCGFLGAGIAAWTGTAVVDAGLPVGAALAAPGTCSRSPSSAVAPPYWPPVSRPRRSRGLSPFTHLATVPDRPVNWPAAAVMTGIGLAAIGAGAAGYRRRDLLR